MNVESPWTVYRTRFVVRARQLTEPLSFTDALGREHSGRPGDYLVESSQGFRRITPCALFEDIYVPLITDPPATTERRQHGARALASVQPDRKCQLGDDRRRPPVPSWSEMHSRKRDWLGASS